MNTWRNLPGKIWMTAASLDPCLRRRAVRAAEALSPGETDLFLAMGRYDLAHCMAVASRLRDDPLLHRAALLHDAGKLRSELGIFTRWMYTALEVLAPSVLSGLTGRMDEGREGDGRTQTACRLPRGWRRGLYVQLHHAEIAAELLAGAGSDEALVRLVGSHQEDPRDELQRRLREADDLL